MRKSHGKMRAHSKQLRKRPRERGAPAVTRYLQEFQTGDMVHIDIVSSEASIPHPKYQGRTGQVIGQRGHAYLVQISDGGKLKTLIIEPVNLKPAS
jgi:large subunit ribosomal protein L21e